MISDSYRPELAADHDVCVVGAGPVGLSTALELAKSCKVLLLEAGDADECRAPTEPTYVPASQWNAPFGATTREGLGGTSSSWGSGCTPYDPIDLAPRSYVAHSGSPVPLSEVSPFHTRASEYLCCEDQFEIQDNTPDGPVRLNRCISYSKIQNIATAHRRLLEENDNVVICANTTVQKLIPVPGTHAIEALDIRSRNENYRLEAKRVVLACGGIGAARLLLCLQDEHPNFLHGENGALGRYYMGHLSGHISRIHFRDKETADKFCFQKSASGIFSRRQITFSPDFLEQNELLNIYFLPTNFPLADAGMRSSVLSAIHLGLAARYMSPHYMKHFLPDYTENPFSPSVEIVQHMKNVLRDPLEAILGATDVIRQRSSNDTGRPPGFHHNSKSRIFSVAYHSEQVPNPDSRVTLSEDRDSHGIKLPIADLKFLQQDFDSVRESHRLLDENLKASKLASLSYMQPLDQKDDHIRSQAVDGYHQIGVTRMSDTPKTGVVDSNLKVHGMENLWISTTGVLPTSSQAHPTFCAVAFAVRLADHLAG